jgi:hypothetical protein
LHKIESQEGPFDYDIDPENGLISFQDAKNAAMALVSSSDFLKEWELDKDSYWCRQFNTWVYSFDFDEAEDVIIDAATGNTPGDPVFRTCCYAGYPVEPSNEGTCRSTGGLYLGDVNPSPNPCP